MHQKMNVLYMPQIGSVEKIKFDHSFIFSSLHLLFLKNTFHLTSFLYHGPLHCLSTKAPLLSLPPQNPLDHINE